MNKLFLTDEEVFELTERKSWTAQKECLRNQRIHFVETASGRPRVMRAALEQRFGISTAGIEMVPVAAVRPNFAALRK